MDSQELNLEKKRGRPSIGRGVQVNAMLRPEEVDQVDAWAQDQPDAPKRPEAIRRLIRAGLVSGLQAAHCY